MENEGLNVNENDCVKLSKKVAELEREIQQLKQSELSHEKHASLYLALVEQASDALYVHDYDGKFIDVNNEACESLGYSKEELLKMNVTDIEVSFNLEQARKEWDNIKYGERHSLIGTHRRKDGTTFPVDIRFGSAKWKGKRIFLVLVRDRSEKLLAEENVRKEKERLEEAEKFAGMGSWENDRATGKGWWSPNLYHIFNLDPSKGFPTVESYLDAIHPDDRHLVVAVFDKMLKGEQPKTDEFRTNPEYGEVRYLLPTVNIKRDSNGNPVRYFGSILDITQRKKAEETLIESEAKFRSLFEASNAGKAVTFLNGQIIVNQAICDMLGYTKEEMLNKKWTDVSPQDDIGHMEMVLGMLISGEKNADRMNKRYIRKDGSVIWTDVSIAVKRDNKGNPLYFVTTVIDITERIKAEAELEALNKKLEERVKERTSELESANRELEAFSYTVSHDLRSPLRKINNYSSFLITDHSEDLNDEGKWFLEKIRKSATGMDRLITDLLNLSHLSKTEIKPEDVKMTEMVKSTYNEVATDEEKGEFEFLLELLPNVKCDPALIKQVWQNLIGNALKYSSKSHTKRIKIYAEDKQDIVTYCIKDYGAGFDENYKAKLFKAFQRLHSDEDFPGTGVGLAIVERIISLHGGSVSAESSNDGGATFSFSLRK
jgi:PAS domain S-box-containing protein